MFSRFINFGFGLMDLLTISFPVSAPGLYGYLHNFNRKFPSYLPLTKPHPSHIRTQTELSN
jgi:hypothetical protein